MNTMIVSGHLGQDAEVKVIRDKEYTAFSIAENIKRINKESGELVETTSWYSVLFPSKSDKFVDLLKKGNKVLVSGELTIDVYRSETKQDVHVSRNIYARTVEILTFAPDKKSQENPEDGTPFLG